MVQRIAWSLLLFFFLIAGWEIATRTFDHFLLVLPPPSRIFWQLGDNASRFLHHTLITLKTILGGLFLAITVAFPLAWIMSKWGTARLILQPLFVITQCIPMFALAPLMVLWFGWGYTAIVIPTALMIFLPLTMNIYQGIRSTPTHLLDYFRIHQASSWQILYKLQLPYALPHIFAGFRIAAIFAGIGAIAGEWAGAQEGLGLLMLESRRGADLEMMFGALFCLILLSLTFYTFIIILERQVFRRKFAHIASKAVMGVLFVLSPLFMACQGGGDVKPATRETRIVLDWLPNPNHVALYAGVEKGYFANRGIHLKIMKIHDASDPLPYLISKQTELAIYYGPSSMMGMAHGARLKVIGQIIPQPLNALIYRKDADITTPADLNGKVLGYCVDGFGTKCLECLLKNKQVVPKEIRNASFDVVSMLGTNQVDVIYGAYWNIECEQLRSLGVETAYFPLADFGLPTYPELVVLAREESVEASPAFTRDFQNALQESIHFSQEYPEEAFEIYLKANPDKGKKTRHWERMAWEKTYPLLALHQEVDEASWHIYESWLKENQLLVNQ